MPTSPILIKVAGGSRPLSLAGTRTPRQARQIMTMALKAAAEPAGG